jgi:hypothetical protein
MKIDFDILWVVSLDTRRIRQIKFSLQNDKVLLLPYHQISNVGIVVKVCV